MLCLLLLIVVMLMVMVVVIMFFFGGGIGCNDVSAGSFGRVLWSDIDMP